MTQLSFLGAAHTVTGSRTILNSNGFCVSIDCGLFQGPKELRLLNWNVSKELKAVQKVILSHAHIDHSGLIPKLIKDGYQGEIICSEATYELCKILLPDSGRLQEEDAYFANKTGHSKHKPALPLYTEIDAIKALTQFRPLKSIDDSSDPEKDWHTLNSDIRFRFLNAGHILGASIVQLEIQSQKDADTKSPVKKITFSGDLGNSKSMILNEPVSLPDSDILILESTYGDRQHPKENILDLLTNTISTVLSRGGTLVIPAFALGRTQEIIHYIRTLEILKRIPIYPVYLDSPMAQSVTQIYEQFSYQLKSSFRNDPYNHHFSTENFKFIQDREQSEKLCADTTPKIVISASGMISGGRVIHHLKTHLSNPLCGVLFAGYQAEGTKGRLIKNGIPRIRLHHEEIPIHASIYAFDSLSAHADIDELIKWVKSSPTIPRRIFLNHGEAGPLQSLKYSLINECSCPLVETPKMGEVFNI